MNKAGKINPDSFKIINERIHNACKNSGRKADDIQIVAVTKTFQVNTI